MSDEETVPAPKVKTITLSKDTSETEFRVEKVTDCIDYAPGTYMNPADVQALCDAADWKVTIIRPNPKSK